MPIFRGSESYSKNPETVRTNASARKELAETSVIRPTSANAANARHATTEQADNLNAMNERNGRLAVISLFLADTLCVSFDEHKHTESQNLPLPSAMNFRCPVENAEGQSFAELPSPQRVMVWVHRLIVRHSWFAGEYLRSGRLPCWNRENHNLIDVELSG